MVSDHLHRKLQQKQNHDKHTRHLLAYYPPDSYVQASPNSRPNAWVPGQIIGSLGPRSFNFIKTSTRHIGRNHVQVQLAPPLNNLNPLPETNQTPTPIFLTNCDHFPYTLLHHLLHLPLPQRHPMMSVHHLLYPQLQQQHRMMSVHLFCHQQFPAKLNGHCPYQPLTPQYHPVFTTL